MSRALVLLFLVGCAESHERSRDGGPGTDASGTDAAVVDAHAAMPDAPGPGVVCGPNVCVPGEICCNAECGVCAFPAECTDFGCPGGP
jgi:hypothetical protein